LAERPIESSTEISLEKQDEDFFLPDICQAQNILFLVLVTELLVFVLVLGNSKLIDFNWAKLGLTSIFVQWIVLVSAAVLCNVRPILRNMSIAAATACAYALILSLTLIFSLIAEWFLSEEPHQLTSATLGSMGRNLIIAAVMSGIAFRYFYLQHQAELNSRIQALQSRIRPHFLFNSMNIIASLISVDPETAEEVVEDLSVLFRASLNDSSDKPVPLSEELSLCEKYVHIESLRLDERLTVEWEVEVDETEVSIPLLTLQPLLENAIYHGVQPIPEGGTVLVQIVADNNQVVIHITNPLPQHHYSHDQGNRMAIENIRNRLRAIYGEQASLVTSNDGVTFHTTVSYPLKKPLET